MLLSVAPPKLRVLVAKSMTTVSNFCRYRPHEFDLVAAPWLRDFHWNAPCSDHPGLCINRRECLCKHLISGPVCLQMNHLKPYRTIQRARETTGKILVDNVLVNVFSMDAEVVDRIDEVNEPYDFAQHR